MCSQCEEALSIPWPRGVAWHGIRGMVERSCRLLGPLLQGERRALATPFKTTLLRPDFSGSGCAGCWKLGALVARGALPCPALQRAVPLRM